MILQKEIPLYHFGLLLCLLIFGACTSNNKEIRPPSTAALVHNQYMKRIDQLTTSVKTLLESSKENAESEKLQDLFKEAKYAYKRTEYLTELYFPHTAKSLNGPPLDEVEFDDINQIIIDPEGFQVIEEIIFPSLSDSNRTELNIKLEQLFSNVHRLKAVTKTTTFTDSHIFDAVRLEIFRIITLGLSGFDSPAALNSIAEASVALKELSVIYNFYFPDAAHKSDNADEVKILFSKALNYLKDHNNFSEFDRLTFIISFANPLSELIFEKQKEANIPVFEELRALSPAAKSLFDTSAFNLDAFAPVYNRTPSAKQVVLGEMLFFDPVLSGNSSRACASCHLPEKGFTDGRSKSLAFGSKNDLQRNAPTVINSGLQASLFYDGRVAFLEDQVADVVLNPDEMHGDFDVAVNNISNSNEYSLLFEEAFDKTKEAVSEKSIKMALASFVRSKTSMNSPFDQYMRGDSNALNDMEILGFNLFMGKAACGTCHFMPLFNGTVPPAFKVSETEILGVPATNDTMNFTLDTDLGKFNSSRKDLHKFAFKTPTLRNITITGPYMHNGVYQTLEEVMDFYNKGGGEGLGGDVPHQTLSPDALDLSEVEVKAIISFMHALTDTTNLNARPKRLPDLYNSVEINQSRLAEGIY